MFLCTMACYDTRKQAANNDIIKGRDLPTKKTQATILLYLVAFLQVKTCSIVRSTGAFVSKTCILTSFDANIFCYSNSV